jgi:hypothetical protein
MQRVLPLPPAVRREEQEAEQIAEAAIGGARREQRVVREVVEERVHAHEEDRRHHAEHDRQRRLRANKRDERPDQEVGDDDAGDLAEAAALVDREIRSQVVLPGAAVGHAGSTTARMSWIIRACVRIGYW